MSSRIDEGVLQTKARVAGILLRKNSVQINALIGSKSYQSLLKPVDVLSNHKIDSRSLSASMMQSDCDRAYSVLSKESLSLENILGLERFMQLRSYFLYMRESASKYQSSVDVVNKQHRSHRPSDVYIDTIGDDWPDMLGETDLMY